MTQGRVDGAVAGLTGGTAGIARVAEHTGNARRRTHRKRRGTDTPWGLIGATPSNRWTPGSG